MNRIFYHVIFIGLLSVAMSTTVLSQIRQTHRYEREQKSGEEYFTIISLNAGGLALIREKDKFEGSKRLWEFIHLDTACNEVSSIEFLVEDRFPMIGYEIAPDNLYLLYRTGETVKNSLLLVELSLTENREAARFDIKPEVDFKITHFSKAGSSLVLGGYVGSDPTILLYHLGSKSIKVVPGFMINETELMELRVNQNQTFNAVLLDRSNRSERKMIFKTFDETGKLLLEDIIPVDEDRSLQTAISSTLEREELMVLGTWGDRQSKQSSGFFSLQVDPFSEQKINYFHFGQLNHFLDHLSPKRAERIKTNTEQDLEEGRKPSFVTYVMPYKIMEHADGYLLLAEIYNPVSVSSPYYTTPYGNPYYTSPYYYSSPYFPGYFPGMRYRPYSYGPTAKAPDEIRTFASVLLAFDPKGNILWDQSMKLDDLEKTSLEQVADFYYSRSKIVFLHRKESDIRAKYIDRATDSTTLVVEKIKLQEASDEIRNEKESEMGIKHWTGNTFYTWGYQTIRNMDLKQDRVREIFYINKVVVPQ